MATLLPPSYHLRPPPLPPNNRPPHPTPLHLHLLPHTDLALPFLVFSLPYLLSLITEREDERGTVKRSYCRGSTAGRTILRPGLCLPTRTEMALARALRKFDESSQVPGANILRPVTYDVCANARQCTANRSFIVVAFCFAQYKIVAICKKWLYIIHRYVH